jgi:ethanolamine ammonia-lyase small subunit
MAYVTLRNISGEPLYLGSPDGRRVDADEVVRVEGSLAKDQPDDAVVVGEGDSARAYPTSLWSKVATGKSGDPDITAPTTAEEK